MEKWIYFVGVIAITAIDFPAAANAQGYGLGTRSCAEFAKSYASNPAVTEEFYFTWAQGFTSGVNASTWAETGTYRDIKGTLADMAAQKLRIRSYCNSHPLAQYPMAIMDLFNSLPIKKENSN
ncbi:MAG TPA: hypothetical protein VMB83_06075 [Roseiarcus sp.]|nr:hypothetical protein [Roseiarcus sp.]